MARTAPTSGTPIPSRCRATVRCKSVLAARQIHCRPPVITRSVLMFTVQGASWLGYIRTVAIKTNIPIDIPAGGLAIRSKVGIKTKRPTDKKPFVEQKVGDEFHHASVSLLKNRSAARAHQLAVAREAAPPQINMR